MPELPEVETVKRGLETALKGKVIKHVTLKRAGLRFPFPLFFVENLEGRTLKTFARRAKYILITFDNDKILLIHLGMSGKLLVHAKMPEILDKHDHVIIECTDAMVAIFNDARRFGVMTLLEKDEIHPLLANLGIEPFSDAFTLKNIYPLLQKAKVSIKQFLMNQKYISGIGNIYASEALFLSGIDPKKETNTIPRPKAEALLKAIRQVLEAAIKSGGSTLRDYVRSSGDVGYFQHSFTVYGRENQSCIKCTSPIRKMTQQGRSTFFCPICQK